MGGTVGWDLHGKRVRLPQKVSGPFRPFLVGILRWGACQVLPGVPLECDPGLYHAFPCLHDLLDQMAGAIRPVASPFPAEIRAVVDLPYQA